MNQRLHLRVLGAALLFVIVLLALYFGGVFAQVELAVLDRATQTNARLHCCAGPHYASSPQLQSEAADDCPHSLRMLRWISRGVSESAAQARQILGGNCPAGSGAVAWSETLAPPSPPPLAAPAAAPVDAGAATAAADAGTNEEASDKGAAEVAPSRVEAASRWWLKPGELRCQEFPPRCGEAACPAFSAGALSAAVDLPPKERASHLRAWLCDAQAAKPVRVALERAADVLRAALPNLVPTGERAGNSADDQGEKEGAGPAKPSPAHPAEEKVAPAASGAGESASEAAAAQRLLCELPWLSLLGQKELLERLHCPECEEGHEGDYDGPPSCLTPGSIRIGSRVCALGYAQALENFSATPPPDVAKCEDESAHANIVSLHEAEGRELDHARSVMTRLRRSVPGLSAAEWKELVDAVFLLRDFGRWPATHADAGAGDARLRERIRPLLAAAAVPKGVDPTKLPESPLSTMSVSGPEGTVNGMAVVVCDDVADRMVQRRALLWVAGERIVALEAPHIDRLDADPSRTISPPSCDEIFDVVDLDGDGQPEVLIGRDDDQYGEKSKSLAVITAADPPIRRGIVSRTYYALPVVEAPILGGGISQKPVAAPAAQ